MELFFLACLVLVGVLSGINHTHHAKIEDRLIDALAANAKTTAELQTKVSDLEEKLKELETTNFDESEFEKRWQDGVNHIMNYSLEEAMRGVRLG